MGNFKQKELTIVGLPANYEPKQEQERSYSKGEVLTILNEFCDNFYENSIRKDVIEKWFEQLKKK